MTIDNRTVIVACIGLVGALGAAVIGKRPPIFSPEKPSVTNPPNPEDPRLPEGGAGTSPTQPAASHCASPTVPVPVSPGDGEHMLHPSQSKERPKLTWLESSCEGGSIRGYRILLQVVGEAGPAADQFVTDSSYRADVLVLSGGLLAAHDWTWKVRAVDDKNQLSEWSEERRFTVNAFHAIFGTESSFAPSDIQNP